MSSVQDPYRPPGSDLARDSGLIRRGEGTFSIREALSEAWSATWANFPLWLGAAVVWMIAVALSTVTVIGIPLLVPVLGWGWILFSLHMLRGRARIEDVFAGFSRYGQVLGPMLAFGMIFFALSLCANAVSYVGQYQQDAALQTVGSLINLAFNLLIVPRLLFAQFYIVDRRAGAIEALTKSWHVTRELKLKAALLVPVLVLLSVAGFLVFVVGVIPAQIMGYLVVASAYRQMEGDPAPVE